MTTTHHPSAARVPTDRPHRGIQHLLHPQVLGVIIGGSGASAFVHVNKDLLPGSWPTVAVLAWAAALFVCAWAVLLRPRGCATSAPRAPAPASSTAPRCSGCSPASPSVGSSSTPSTGRS